MLLDELIEEAHGDDREAGPLVAVQVRLGK